MVESLRNRAPAGVAGEPGAGCCSCSCATLSQASGDLWNQTPGSFPGWQVPRGASSLSHPHSPCFSGKAGGRTFFTEDLGSDPGSAHVADLVKGLAPVVLRCSDGLSAALTSGYAILVPGDSQLLVWLVQQQG